MLFDGEASLTGLFDFTEAAEGGGAVHRSLKLGGISRHALNLSS
jgi:hypothetical protein